DAVGIGLFTAGGIQISLQAGVNEVYAIIMGVISATFGGLLADILSNEVPALLKRGELYATACLIGAFSYIGLKHTSLDADISLLLCVCVIVGIRVVSKWKRLRLPDI
ncbi:MAG TPA: hypothetical protein DIW54_06230, partial [Chitinophagaceae bacterium]|nr:hypothetical protein [Chitinophagaceae bacterium]